MEKPLIEFETERLYVRPVRENDKEEYMALRASTSILSEYYEKNSEHLNHEWNNEFNSKDNIYLSVFLKENGSFAASCSFQKYQSDTIEFGFDVMAEYRNQGFATELVKGMLRVMHLQFPGKSVKIRTRKDNAACRRVADKCGGIIVGYEPDPLFTLLADLAGKIREDAQTSPALKKRVKEIDDLLAQKKETVCVYRIDP